MTLPLTYVIHHYTTLDNSNNPKNINNNNFLTSILPKFLTKSKQDDHNFNQTLLPKLKNAITNYSKAYQLLAESYNDFAEIFDQFREFSDLEGVGCFEKEAEELREKLVGELDLDLNEIEKKHQGLNLASPRRVSDDLISTPKFFQHNGFGGFYFQNLNSQIIILKHTSAQNSISKSKTDQL